MDLGPTPSPAPQTLAGPRERGTARRQETASGSAAAGSAPAPRHPPVEPPPRSGHPSAPAWEGPHGAGMGTHAVVGTRRRPRSAQSRDPAVVTVEMLRVPACPKLGVVSPPPRLTAPPWGPQIKRDGWLQPRTPVAQDGKAPGGSSRTCLASSAAPRIGADTGNGVEATFDGV